MKPTNYQYCDVVKTKHLIYGSCPQKQEQEIHTQINHRKSKYNFETREATIKCYERKRKGTINITAEIKLSSVLKTRKDFNRQKGSQCASGLRKASGQIHKECEMRDIL